jgi:glycine cleavage system protein P-like pyridoxal-binding family
MGFYPNTQGIFELRLPTELSVHRSGGKWYVNADRGKIVLGCFETEHKVEEAKAKLMTLL